MCLKVIKKRKVIFENLIFWHCFRFQLLPKQASIRSRNEMYFKIDNDSTNLFFSFFRGYTTQLSLYIVGVLRKYHTIFLLNPTDVVTAFDQLSRIAYRPKLPPTETGASNSMQDYNSAEWCILAYLYDLCNNCSTLKNSAKHFKTS